MKEYSIIVRPVITEQSIHFANVRNVYAFEVNPKANKLQIRQAIEKIYNVKVRDVRTAHMKGKPRRRGRHFIHTKAWKKAFVVLHPDYRIDLY
ncbi:MAG TPA: 50S ribosomal protein L23 [Anaerohalosphaeraceae bacterium]|nr:50S ribosomal protein L23 [Phycisphaerae bacterium]HOM61042.1 50S ribosomal protein L23 [Anaerohalosphaeraceae bacterium]HOT71898.1 50S ribosomal protein L23 [Anaerohalosphaeraceae bacterium]HPB92007.1 50S ribosomal protein L23 [Anaerohalosphaeraceae bacterium]HQG05300.1 50S ribosomal protein L23 [Anaerohalosphaeraceae bacterium]